MDDTDMNGGNAEIKREYPNLEGSSKMLELKEEVSPENMKMEEQEVNGDFADAQNKVPAPVAKRAMRSSKANSTSTNEDEAKTPVRGKKRKLSEPDISSDDSDFNGFELSENLEPANTVLKKLIAEVESTDDLQIIRRFSSSKSVIKDKIFELKQEDLDTDSLDNKMKIDEDKDFHKAGDALSISGASSANSSPSASSQKSRSNRLSRGASPGSAIRQKVSLELSNPAYKEPFKFGWKRELVYRSGSEANSKKLADVYYYTPKGKKVRSFRELAEFLKTKDLVIDNFTFTKEPLGLDDPEKEIIRDAKKSKDPTGTAITSTKKLLPVKKSTPAKKPVEETMVTVVPPLPVSPPVAKTSVKSPKATPTATSKAKVPVKKSLSKGKAKPLEETEMRPPQWSSPAATRKNAQAVEKSPPPKNKRTLKKKPVLVETDQRQNFMVSVCAGYHALSRIFQYLKVQELLRAARVCKMWRDLAAHPALWKTVRMKNSQVTDWTGLAESLKRHGTQHLDLRKMLYTRESDEMWNKFVSVIPTVSSLVKLELCRCPGSVVEEIFKSCPQLEVLSAMSIKCDFLSLESAGNLKRCQELRLKAVTGMSIKEDLSPLQELTQLTHLSLTSIKELGKKKIELLRSLENLETLELGECSDFPEKFGTSVLMSLRKLERLRLEKGQGSCCTFDILEGVSQMESLIQLELINFDVKNGFDKWLAKCKNIKKLLIIPTYISQSATSNNMVLGGVIELSDSLTHFVWGVTFELLKVTELFVDQENHASRESSGDCIPILKPVPYIKLIKDVDDDKDNQEGGDKQQQNLTLKNPQVEILSLTQIRKLLFTVLPKTRVNILKMAFHATWRQSISDTTT